jgi:hypothetical protein
MLVDIGKRALMMDDMAGDWEASAQKQPLASSQTNLLLDRTSHLVKKGFHASVMQAPLTDSGASSVVQSRLGLNRHSPPGGGSLVSSQQLLNTTNNPLQRSAINVQMMDADPLGIHQSQAFSNPVDRSQDVFHESALQQQQARHPQPPDNITFHSIKRTSHKHQKALYKGKAYKGQALDLKMTRQRFSRPSHREQMPERIRYGLRSLCSSPVPGPIMAHHQEEEKCDATESMGIKRPLVLDRDVLGLDSNRKLVTFASEEEFLQFKAKYQQDNEPVHREHHPKDQVCVLMVMFVSRHSG